MSTLDIDTVAGIVDELWKHRPHLPQRRHLPQAVRGAWNRHQNTAGMVQVAAISAVIEVAWPVAYTAGADRGHTFAVDLIHAAVAAARHLNPPRHARHAGPGASGERAVADPLRREPWVAWFLHAAARAATDLPERAALSGAGRGPTVRGLHIVTAPELWGEDTQQLRQAVMLGLDAGWRVGHREAARAMAELFTADVIDMVGEDAVTTTFLTADTPAYTWLDAVEDEIEQAGEHDRTHPPPLTTPTRTDRPVVARAFVPLTRVSRAPGTRPGAGQPPPAGPGRRPHPQR